MLLSKHDPFAIQITGATTGKYLGFYIGPGNGDKSWEKPLAKYTERLREWRWGELGVHLAMTTYNVFVLPVLLFVAQLERPPQSVLVAAAAAVRKVAPGPGWWCAPADMHHATELGLSTKIRHLLVSCQAAMLRTHAWEASASGGISWRGMARELLDASSHSDRVVLRGLWHA
eukprot:4960706-Pyramimonas_sp.AAC.1